MIYTFIVSSAVCILSVALFKVYHQTKCGYRRGSEYILCKAQIDNFRRDGLAILDGILTENELKGIERVYDRWCVIYTDISYLIW